jgi:hypothetical protein
VSRIYTRSNQKADQIEKIVEGARTKGKERRERAKAKGEEES